MITVEYLRSIFDLNYERGFLYWKLREIGGSWNSKHAGQRAGSDKGNGYRTIRIDGKSFMEHRIIYAIATGVMPGNDPIDHINGDRADNRPSNLRAVSNTDNVRKRHRLNRNNTSGAIGVHWSRAAGKWCAVIKVDRATIYLGTFESRDEAIATRRNAELKHFGTFAPSLASQP